MLRATPFQPFEKRITSALPLHAIALESSSTDAYRAAMPTAILKAHYDGEHIVLDEPFDLPANASLVVTVFDPDMERSEWTDLGTRSLARAYGDDEPEYTTADLKPQ